MAPVQGGHNPPPPLGPERPALGAAGSNSLDSDVVARVVQRRHAVVEVDDVGPGGLAANELEVDEEAVAHVLAVLKADAILRRL